MTLLRVFILAALIALATARAFQAARFDNYQGDNAARAPSIDEIRGQAVRQPSAGGRAIPSKFRYLLKAANAESEAQVAKKSF